MELLTQLGRYQILERIAQGGMADVYLARTVGVEGFEKRLVVKQIRPHLARNPRLVSLFINEARIAVCLNHPNIVQVYELNRVGDDWFIVMEYIHGRDLTRVVRALRAQGRLLPIPLAVHAVASALRGLGYAHARTDAEGRPLGIVHGDVSPHNLVVSFTGDVKVVDFGIARLAGKGFGEEVGQPGGGKFAYMSPEQVAGRPLDHRSDIFSAGIVLYEVLVGHRLYQHEDPDEKLRRVREAVVPDPRVENPQIPDALWEILQRALARDPADRFPRAEDFEEELRAFLFHAALRGDSTAMAAFTQALFAEEWSQDPTAGNLQRLAEDLARLEAGPAGSLPPAPAVHAASADRSDAGVTGTPPWLSPGTEELKSVAVLSVEVAGRTDVSFRHDTASLSDRHRAWARWFQRLARRHGARVQEAGSEGATFIFGVPRVRGDDLGRALACALEMRAGAGGLPDPAAALCMGVHHGEVLVRSAREAAGSEVLGLGDTTKLARRLASTADTGEIRVSERVVALAQESFQIRPSSPVSSRGRLTPSWVLEGRAADRRHGRWVVRGDEVEILRQALVTLGDGGGSLLLEGDPGIGKSRFVEEVAGLARRREVAVHRARTWPFGSERPLAFVRDLVASVTGIAADDPPREVRRKLDRLAHLHLPPADVAVLSGLFALGPQRGEEPGPPGELVAEACRRFLVGLCADGPVLVVLEDVQYLDRHESAVLGTMLRGAQDRTLLFILTAGPGISHDLDRTLGAVGTRRHRLGPAAPEGVARLVADLLDTAAVAPDLLALVHRETGGNPLHVLELVRALDRQGALRRDAAEVGLAEPAGRLPVVADLRRLVEARIDALPPPERGLLLAAGVVGMRFPFRLLAEAVGLEGLEALVEGLVARGLLVARGAGREAVLEFCSRSVWEVADQALLGAPRREAHAAVARAMEVVYADHLEPHLETLARHQAGAGQPRRAVARMAQAGDTHRKGGFLERALACYGEALGWMDELAGQAEDSGLGASLHLRAGETAHLLGQARKAERHLQVALDDAEEEGLKDVEAAACLALGRACMAAGRRMEARAYLEQVDELAPLAPGGELLALEALETRGQLALEEGDDREAERIFGALLERAGDQGVLGARALLGLANHCLHQDDLERALVHLERARSLAEDAREHILLGRILNNIGIVCHGRGQYEEALDLFRRALEVREHVGYRAGRVINLHNIGDTWFRLGDAARAWAAFERSTELAREAGWRRGVVMSAVFLGYLKARRGEGAAIAEVRDAVEEARRLGDLEVVATGLWLLARWQAAQGQVALAQDSLALAHETALGAGAATLARKLGEEDFSRLAP